MLSKTKFFLEFILTFLLGGSILPQNLIASPGVYIAVPTGRIQNNSYVFYHRSTHGCKSMHKASVKMVYFNEDE
jgi:hypothetical protein